VLKNLSQGDLLRLLVIFLITGAVNVGVNSHKGAPLQEILWLFLTGAGTGTGSLLLQSPLKKE